MEKLLLSYYGDDFTGSTDVLEALSLHGIPTVLFLHPPTRAELAARFPAARAIGVAGLTRTFGRAALEAAFRPAVVALQALGAEILHYKVCSTFDSSPATGSIGLAAEIGADVTGAQLVPVIVGAPRLRRHVVFGNLFAGVVGETHRLDRHPTMSCHPVTPMRESDLRRHLAEQTKVPGKLIDVLALAAGPAAVSRLLKTLEGTLRQNIFFDTLDDGHLATIGQVLWQQRAELGRFVVGSSGVEWALGSEWRRLGLAPAQASVQAAGAVSHMLAMTGSASPATDGQIAAALEAGWAGIRLPMETLIDPASPDATWREIEDGILTQLQVGRSVVAYATRGGRDPAMAATRARATALGLPSAASAAAAAQARLLQRLLSRQPLPRVLVAGGDTSGWAAQALGINALEFIQPLAPGAPLCRAHLPEATAPALQIVLKGGQVGGPDFFESVRLARTEDPVNPPAPAQKK